MKNKWNKDCALITSQNKHGEIIINSAYLVNYKHLTLDRLHLASSVRISHSVHQFRNLIPLVKLHTLNLSSVSSSIIVSSYLKLVMFSKTSPVPRKYSYLFKRPGPGCSKLTTSLVNMSLKFQKLISQISRYFLLKKCVKLLHCKSFSHFFNKKIQCIWL